MTIATEPTAGVGRQRDDLVTLTIDGVEVERARRARW